MPEPGVQGVGAPPGFEDQFILSQPRGQIIFITLLFAPKISRPSDIPDWRNEVVHIRSQASYDNFNLGFGLHHDCIITINFLIHDGAKPFIISYLKYLCTQQFHLQTKESIIKVFF